ncbi:PHP domain-containing protein [Kiritimatiella glycovorans]|uniref:Polymerase/histidinol phosphatase N-terminal domain-containing protein n=1 Tax=Kiritimatiella glycovorans TaxID=1307763 RepID=A0A0G3EIC7_9BACT|nr:PHP domain-containing protein [Kiritimatiella glycovorans]AKJ63889.1 hypothetical protein L21SP4_00620 [Kiritimatiella glycovorans]
MRSRRIAAFMVGIALAAGFARADDYRCAVHIHSRASYGGVYGLEELSALAERRGIDAVFLTDSHALQAEYGPPPFRHLAAVRYNLPSVMTLGPRRYLREIRRYNESGSGVLFVPGVEVIPRHYWDDRIAPPRWTLHNTQRNLMLLGCEKPRVIRRIPATLGFLPRRDRAARGLVALLVGAVLVLASGYLWFPAAASRWDRLSLRAWKGRYLVLALLPLIAAAAILEIVFGSFDRYDLYGARRDCDTEQRVIDYGQRHGAFVYWAHPEAFDHHEWGPLTMDTRPYPEVLSKTRGYHAFGVLYEQETTLYREGSRWDTVLREVLQGARMRPVWGIGEMLYREEGHAGKQLGNVDTVIRAPALTRDALMGALRRGRFYASRRNPSTDERLTLRDFTVNGVYCGGYARTSDGAATVQLSVGGSATNEPVRVAVIRDGTLWREEHATPPFELAWTDDEIRSGERHYYRCYVEGAYPVRLVANPVFVE